MIKIPPVPAQRPGSQRPDEEFAREQAPAWQPTDMINHNWALDTTHHDAERHTDSNHDRVLCPPEVYIG